MVELRLALTMQGALIDNLILVRVILEDQVLSVPRLQQAYDIVSLYKAKVMLVLNESIIVPLSTCMWIHSISL